MISFTRESDGKVFDLDCEEHTAVMLVALLIELAKKIYENDHVYDADMYDRLRLLSSGIIFAYAPQEISQARIDRHIEEGTVVEIDNSTDELPQTKLYAPLRSASEA